MFNKFVVNYIITGKSNEEITKIANAVHKELVGNEDYVNSAILINFQGTDLNIYVWPEECKRPVPDILKSYADFMIFCRMVISNENN